MKITTNYAAQIWIGFKLGYDKLPYDYNSKDIYRRLKNEIREYVDANPVGVTVTKTQFIYPGGDEYGAVIGLINYARFPKTEAEIKAIALELGAILMKKFEQYRISVTFDAYSLNGSILLENDELKEK